HAQATAALWSVLLDSGALTVAAGGSHQQVAAFLDDRQAQQLVIAAETHALNAGSCTAHWAQLLIIGSKANGLALLRGQQDIVIIRNQLLTDQIRSLYDVYHNQTSRTCGFIISQTGLLHAPLLGC